MCIVSVGSEEGVLIISEHEDDVGLVAERRLDDWGDALALPVRAPPLRVCLKGPPPRALFRRELSRRPESSSSRGVGSSRGGRFEVRRSPVCLTSFRGVRWRRRLLPPRPLRGVRRAEPRPPLGRRRALGGRASGGTWIPPAPWICCCDSRRFAS